MGVHKRIREYDRIQRIAKIQKRREKTAVFILFMILGFVISGMFF